MKGALGEGGMGEVVLARQASVGRDVAVKGLRQNGRTQAMRMALLREGWTIGRLEHPNIVPVYTMGRDADGEPIVVMKRIGGVSWAQLLAEPSKARRDFDADDPLEWHVDILAQVCNAVQYAHSKAILHRDLKPENVMIGQFGEVYVLDWGIAVSLDADAEGRIPTVDDATSPAGTPAYMAPEMVTGEDHELSRRTDIYLLGAMLHEIVTGQPPHQGQTIHEVMYEAFCSRPVDYDDDVPAVLAHICQRAMCAEPAERFESVDAFRQALQAFKRHRESVDLGQEAERRRLELQAMLAEPAGEDQPGEAQLYKLFGECRFGFEQALRVEAENASASRGFQQVLEMMADRELDRGAFQAASLLIADFPEARPTYDRRLAELGERLKSRQQEFEDLQQIKRDVDPDVGRRARSFLALVLGVIFGAMALLVHVGRLDWGWPITYATMVAHAVSLTLMVVATLFIGRRRLFKNSASQAMMVGLVAMLVGAVCYRVVVWIGGFPLMASIAGEMLYYATGGTLLGITQDKRTIPATLVFVPGALVTASFPEWAMVTYGVTCLMVFAVLAWMFWPGGKSTI